jgi:dethiobiotin synthetase
MRGVFVAGTDTGIGKSVLAASICAALAARGESVAAFKPVVTGLDEDAEPGWPRDHELLAGASSVGQTPDEVAPYRFGPPVSPHYAAELAGVRIERAGLIAAALRATRDADALVCEGVGGVLVPLTSGYLVRDLAVDLDLPVVVATGTGLGTINRSLLTVEALGARTAGIVMTPWPSSPEPMELSNRETVERLAGVPVSGLPPTDRDGLVAAAGDLPLDDWLRDR